MQKKKNAFESRISEYEKLILVAVKIINMLKLFKLWRFFFFPTEAISKAFLKNVMMQEFET